MVKKLRGNRIERLFNQLQNNRAQCGIEEQADAESS